MKHRIILLAVGAAAFFYGACSAGTGMPAKAASAETATTEAAKPQPGVEAFFSAVRGNNSREVLRLLAGGFGVDSKNEKGNTALLEAVLNRQSAMAGLLVSKGADARTACAGGETALAAAIKWGNLALLGRIIDSIPERERDVDAAIVSLLLRNLRAPAEKKPAAAVPKARDPAAEELKAELRREILAEIESKAEQFKSSLREEAARQKPVELLRLTDILKDR